MTGAGRLSGKVALVTGAARGIGRACAVRFAEEGCDVALVDLAARVETVEYSGASEDDLEASAELVRAAGARALTARADVRDAAALERAVAETVAALGGVDAVVAAAGVESHAPAWEVTEDQWRTVMDVNLTGVWHTARAVMPLMRERRQGSIVFIGSVNSHFPTPGFSHYVVSKHGVLGLTRALALELGPSMVRVNAVAPVATATELLRAGLEHMAGPDEDALDRMRRARAIPVAMVEPVDIANAALFLASDEARYVTGISLPVDAGRLLGSTP
jgi:SDR family mycofactocin-dependent oxidoreductase